MLYISLVRRSCQVIVNTVYYKFWRGKVPAIRWTRVKRPALYYSRDENEDKSLAERAFLFKKKALLLKDVKDNYYETFGQYPVNYGYIEGLFAPDGEEQDAYILGVDLPLTDFTGKVIAIVHRLNDNEDKWIVVPDNTHYTREQILDRISFQEQFFESEIIM